MALKSSSPLNLAALRQDYSMLPKIAAVKAQANQQMISAIQSGLEKRKERIEKKEKNALNEKLLQDLIDSDPNNTIIPAGVTSKELAKYITLEETMSHRRALDTANRAAAKEAQLIQAARNAANKLGLPPGVAEANPRGVLEAAMKAQIESLKGTEPEYKIEKITNPDGTIKYVRVNVKDGTFTDITKQAATSKPSQAVLPGGLSASRVDPKTGKPISQPVPSGGSLISSPSLAEQRAEAEAKRESQTEDILNLYRFQARTGPVDIAGIAKQLKISEPVVSGIIEENLTKIRSEAFSKLQEKEKSLPGIIEYVGYLASIDKSKGQPQGSGFLGLTGKEYEAGFFDVEANPKFNVFLKDNPEILRIYGVPENTIADIIGLESQLTNELSSGTKFDMQELNSAARPFE